MISSEEKEQVRQATDFVTLVSETVELTRRGREFWGRCPFHQEKSPSFHIMPDLGLWKCFGCGEGGDVFSYVMKREGLEFQDSIRYLADRAGIELHEERGSSAGPKRNRLLECLAEAERYYHTMLMRGKGQGSAEARAYLARRNFGSAVARRWKLGYAPGYGQLVAHLTRSGYTRAEMEATDLAVMRQSRPADRFYNRVMFPIHDELGRTIAFGGRVLTDAKPKYLNTKETRVFHKGRQLFAFDVAKEHIAAKGEAIVCEGYTDVISLHEHGFRNVVAALGTSFSIDHVKTLERFCSRIVCMFDGDAAGQRAAERAIQFLDQTTSDIRCVVLDDNLDPAEFLEAHTTRELEERLEAAKPLMSFVLEQRVGTLDPSASAGVRRGKLAEIARVLAPLRSSVLFDEYARDVAALLGFDVEAVKREVRRAPLPRRDAAAPAAQATASPAAGADEPYFDGYYYEGYDYGDGADAAGASDVGALSAFEPAIAVTADEREQLVAEVELLSLMARDIDAFRGSAERIASMLWASEEHEAMAWAMLATPEGASPQEVVAAARTVSGGAAATLASGRVASFEGWDDARKAAFCLDAADLYSTRRKIAVMRARFTAGEATSEAFREATELKRYAAELQRRLEVTSGGQ